MMYESMKVKVGHVLERGTVGDQYITSDHEREAFNKWSNKFTRQDHPAVIQVWIHTIIIRPFFFLTTVLICSPKV
jgi:hypothetical protein